MASPWWKQGDLVIGTAVCPRTPDAGRTYSLSPAAHGRYNVTLAGLGLVGSGSSLTAAKRVASRDARNVGCKF